MNASNHHYTECGLDNIFVQGISLEDDAGEEFIHIPALGELHVLIAQSLLAEGRSLSGKEFYFLRAELGMNIQSIAEKLALDIAELQQWEDNNTVSSSTDFAFREFFKERYSNSNQTANLWQQNEIAIPSAYSEKVTQEKITIEYGSDNYYHLLAA